MITITKNIEEATFVTHAGNFHADDVFSTVFLEKLYDNITLIRLKDYQDNDSNKLAYDIGLGKFDHHQTDYKSRSNGIHYCSFGLLWQDYGKTFLKKINVEDIDTTFDVLDKLLVTQIDAVDNGDFSLKSSFNVYLLDSLVSLFRPSFDSLDDEDSCFLNAVNFARIIFDQVLKDVTSKVKVIKKVKTLIPTIKDKVLVLDEFIPYEYSIYYLNLDIEFVIYPSNRGGYAAHTVAKHYKGFDSLVPFKKEWAGLRDEELQKVSGIKTAKFCHNKLFLATALTLEDTLKFIELTRNKKDA